MSAIIHQYICRAGKGKFYQVGEPNGLIHVVFFLFLQFFPISGLKGLQVQVSGYKNILYFLEGQISNGIIFFRIRQEREPHQADIDIPLLQKGEGIIRGLTGDGDLNLRFFFHEAFEDGQENILVEHGAHPDGEEAGLAGSREGKLILPGFQRVEGLRHVAIEKLPLLGYSGRQLCQKVPAGYVPYRRPGPL